MADHDRVDIDHHELLRRVARRGTVRGAGAVLAAARVPLTDDPTRADPPRLGRKIVLVVAALVVLAVGVALGVRAGGDRGPADGGGTCRLYLPPDTDAAGIDVLERTAWADADVASVRRITKEEALEEFRRLYAERPEFLAAVTDASILPPSLQVGLHDPGAGAQEAFVARWQGHPDLLEVHCPGIEAAGADGSGETPSSQLGSQPVVTTTAP